MSNIPLNCGVLGVGGVEDCLQYFLQSRRCGGPGSHDGGYVRAVLAAMEDGGRVKARRGWSRRQSAWLDPQIYNLR